MRLGALDTFLQGRLEPYSITTSSLSKPSSDGFVALQWYKDTVHNRTLMMWSVLTNDIQADCGMKKVTSSDHINVSQQLVALKKVTNIMQI